MRIRKTSASYSLVAICFRSSSTNGTRSIDPLPTKQTSFRDSHYRAFHNSSNSHLIRKELNYRNVFSFIHVFGCHFCGYGCYSLLQLWSTEGFDVRSEPSDEQSTRLLCLRPPWSNWKQNVGGWTELGNLLSFVFNICRDVVSIPKYGNGGNNCQRTVHDLDSDGNEILESRPVPVFLVDQDSDDCRRMAGSLEDEGNIYWSPYGTIQQLV